MLINGDCFNYVKTIPDNSVDLILIDPPYLISKESNFKNYSDSANKELVTKYGELSIDFGDWDKVYIDWISLFKEYNRILKDGGTLIVFFDIWKSGLIKEAAELNKFKQPRVCQWQKTNPVPVNSKKNYLSNAIEYFFTFTKGKNPTFNSEYDNGVYRYPICHGKERLNHPTQKPLRLIVDLINKHSKPGDVVLDTFAGSGTTGHASILTGRNYILVEKSEEYFKILEERIKNVSNKKEF
jgi:site-specific DNA-methyltransferase (adenine-specific)